jgi:hypothetical protein
MGTLYGGGGIGGSARPSVAGLECPAPHVTQHNEGPTLYSGVSPDPLSADTSAAIAQLQIERWRKMSPADKAALVAGLTQAVYELARAGIRHRYPSASSREQFLRLAIVTLGPDLARKAYPDLVSMDVQ